MRQSWIVYPAIQIVFLCQKCQTRKIAVTTIVAISWPEEHSKQEIKQKTDLEWCPTSPKDPPLWNKNNKMPTSGWICKGSESVPSEEAHPGREHKPSRKVKGCGAHCSHQPGWLSASQAGPNRLFWFRIPVLSSLLLGAFLSVDWQHCTLTFVFSASWNVLLFLSLT